MQSDQGERQTQPCLKERLKLRGERRGTLSKFYVVAPIDDLVPDVQRQETEQPSLSSLAQPREIEEIDTKWGSITWLSVTGRQCSGSERLYGVSMRRNPRAPRLTPEVRPTLQTDLV